MSHNILPINYMKVTEVKGNKEVRNHGRQNNFYYEL